MRRFLAVLICLLILGGAAGYGLHLWKNYQAIQQRARDRAAEVVTPIVNSDSVSEIGYIYQAHSENYIREGFSTMDWFIVVPSTGDRLGCGYVAGSPDFRVGDGITVIHNVKSLDSAEVGYFVGLHGSRKGKVAKVACNDQDVVDLEIDDAR